MERPFVIVFTSLVFSSGACHSRSPNARVWRSRSSRATCFVSTSVLFCPGSFQLWKYHAAHDAGSTNNVPQCDVGDPRLAAATEKVHLRNPTRSSHPLRNQRSGSHPSHRWTHSWHYKCHSTRLLVTTNQELFETSRNTWWENLPNQCTRMLCIAVFLRIQPNLCHMWLFLLFSFLFWLQLSPPYSSPERVCNSPFHWCNAWFAWDQSYQTHADSQVDDLLPSRDTTNLAIVPQWIATFLHLGGRLNVPRSWVASPGNLELARLAWLQVSHRICSWSYQCVHTHPRSSVLL